MASISDVKLRGNYYRIRGNMINGHHGLDAEGNPIPFIQLADYTRRITGVNHEKGKLYCECGRVFLIDGDLVLEEMSY